MELTNDVAFDYQAAWQLMANKGLNFGDRYKISKAIVAYNPNYKKGFIPPSFSMKSVMLKTIGFSIGGLIGSLVILLWLPICQVIPLFIAMVIATFTYELGDGLIKRYLLKRM